MSKLYIVLNGHQPGVYNHWYYCQKQLNNYPNAKFKVFREDDLKTGNISVCDQEYLDIYYESLRLKSQIKCLNNEDIYIDKKAIIAVGECSNSICLGEFYCIDINNKKKIISEYFFERSNKELMDFLATSEAIKYALTKKLKTVYTESTKVPEYIKNGCAHIKLQRNPKNNSSYIRLIEENKWLKDNHKDILNINVVQLNKQKILELINE